MKKNNQPVKPIKKLSLLSAIAFVIGSSIGAGIFLKNNEVLKNTGYSIVLSLVVWLIAFAGILAMAFALIEIVSGANKQNKEGIAGWVKTFNDKYLYVGARNFMAYIYLPVNAFVMPYYAIQQLFDGIGLQQGQGIYQWYWLALISFGVILYFLITASLSSKVANIQNIITLGAKFLPLIVAACIGFIWLGTHPGNIGQNAWLPTNRVTPDVEYFSTLSPYLGVLMSIPSVLFVVDGFYSSTAIQSDMKEPQKMPKAILIGLCIVLAIDLIIAISLMFGPERGGGISIFQGWLNANVGTWAYQVLQILISIGILGIINSMCAYSYKMYEQMGVDNTIFLSRWFKNKISQKPFALGFVYNIVLNCGVFIIATIIGCFFINTSLYEGDKTINGLYSFVDLTANWTSLFAFLIICIAIVGGIFNRKTHKIKTEQKKYFVPMGIFAVIIIIASTLMATANAFGNLILSIKDYKRYSQEVGVDFLVGSILMVITLLLFLLILFFPWIKNKIFNKQKKQLQR